MKPTVCAVMKVTVEIPMRASDSNETFIQMYEASQREAEGILRNKLGPEFRVIGPVEFSHAVIKELK